MKLWRETDGMHSSMLPLADGGWMVTRPCLVRWVMEGIPRVEKAYFVAKVLDSSMGCSGF